MPACQDGGANPSALSLPRQLATARSKTKTKPRRVKRALHRSPATPDVHEPDFVPDPATRPRQRSIWHEIDADPAPAAAPKNNGHDGLKPLFLRLCFDKQLTGLQTPPCTRRPAQVSSVSSDSTGQSVPQLPLPSLGPADATSIDYALRTPNSVSCLCCSPSQVRGGLCTNAIPLQRSPTSDLLPASLPEGEQMWQYHVQRSTHLRLSPTWSSAIR